MIIKVFEEKTLYGYWKPYMKDYFEGVEPIINLASAEFSKLVPYPMVDVVFKENTSKGYRIVGTYSKIARGQMLRFMAENEIEDVESIKLFDYGDYKYNHEESNDHLMVFSR